MVCFSPLLTHSDTRGYGEYCTRGGYLTLIKTLNAANYTVLAYDHQGHGESKGDRAYIESIDGVIGDLVQFVKESSSQYPGKPSVFTKN